MRIKQLLVSEPNIEVEVKGWVRFFRNNQFIALNDGSCMENIQLVLSDEKATKELIANISVGASLRAKGSLVESQGKGQRVEVQVSEIEVLGESNPDKYPLQPKRHSLEFLRGISNFRPRTNLFGAIFRVRHQLSVEVHRYFSERGFFNLHTPIITHSDCEGAGEMFRISSFPDKDFPQTKDGRIDHSQDFFGTEANLTVSGQLDAEIAMMGLGQVYTFGPTFRAENSNTSRHLAEFWMIEPEAAFYDLNDNMDLATDFVQTIIKNVLIECADEIAFLEQRRLDELKREPQKKMHQELPLGEKLSFVTDNDFVRISYTEAYQILRNSKPNKKQKFDYTIDQWGVDFQSEHERFLVEKQFKSPVIIYDYPEQIKSFYMRSNQEPENTTVAAMDVLFPGIGEIIGGSQREERLEVLTQKMKQFEIPQEKMQWYLDTRKFGTIPHSGFGLGFERLVLFVTGMTNIRDVILSPRAANYMAY